MLLSINDTQMALVHDPNNHHSVSKLQSDTRQLKQKKDSQCKLEKGEGQTLSFSVQPIYFKYRSWRNSDG
jgi:hypothetical protein